ncbi:unnamed protein product [Phaeothamnion confervicola]
MEPSSIRSMLIRKPFLPFRIYLNDGRNFLITRPELVFIGGSTTVIGIVRNVDNEFWDEPVILANRRITSLEPIVEAPATS